MFLRELLVRYLTTSGAVCNRGLFTARAPRQEAAVLYGLVLGVQTESPYIPISLRMYKETERSCINRLHESLAVPQSHVLDINVVELTARPAYGPRPGIVLQV